MTVEEAVAALRASGNPASIEGRARYGIRPGRSSSG